MNILAIDTSQRDLSLAVARDDQVLRSRNVKFDKDISARMTSHINILLKDAKMTLNDLNGLAVGLGPGSFTGLRISLAAVKALAYSLNIPVVGVPSLEAIAVGLKEKKKDICVLVDAKRDLFYSCLYNQTNGQLKQTGSIKLAPLSDILKQVKIKTIFAGNGIALAKESILSKKKDKASFAKQTLWKPQAKHLLPLAMERFKEKRFDDPKTLVPIYLYPKDCQVIQK